MDEILNAINEISVAEKGSRVSNLEAMVRDLDLDSFGYTVLMLGLDDKFGLFSDVPEGTDPFSTIDWDNITIKELVDRCM